MSVSFSPAVCSSAAPWHVPLLHVAIYVGPVCRTAGCGTCGVKSWAVMSIGTLETQRGGERPPLDVQAEEEYTEWCHV